MKRKLAKRKKVVESDLSDDNSFHDGITTLQGFTAGGKPHLGGNNMRAIGTHSVGPPGTRLVTGHQSASPGTSQPGTGLPGTRQLITGQPGIGLPGTGQPGTVHQIPSTSSQALVIKWRLPDTGQSITGHHSGNQAPVNQALGNQSPGTRHQSTHQAPVIRQQRLSPEHRVSNYRQRSSEQSLANEPQHSRNTQRILLPLENQTLDSVVIDPPY